MGEILGLGGTHYPALAASDQHMLAVFHTILGAPQESTRAGRIAQIGRLKWSLNSVLTRV
jgi:hypothetical protein